MKGEKQSRKSDRRTGGEMTERRITESRQKRQLYLVTEGETDMKDPDEKVKEKRMTECEDRGGRWLPNCCVCC